MLKTIRYLLQKTVNQLNKVINLIGRTSPSIDARGAFLRDWFSNNGDKTHRLNYTLSKDSLVFDLGGYEGQWASDIFAIYQSQVYLFEPVTHYAANIEARFTNNPNIKIFTYGLSNENKTETISMSADGSSIFIKSEQMEEIKLKRAADFFEEYKVSKIDLMKINIEGGEYDLLDHLLATGLIKLIVNIQVQFHDFIPNAKERMAAIQSELKKTHHLTYQYPFVWENWALNNGNTTANNHQV